MKITETFYYMRVKGTIAMIVIKKPKMAIYFTFIFSFILKKIKRKTSL